MNLRPQRRNANKHSEHGLRLLEKSLQRDGWIDAQTIAADGEMISGSARLEVAGEKFADVEPIIVESDGTRPVIVKRTDIPNADDPRARRLSVAANQIAATDWNPDGDLLKEWGNEDKDIRAMFSADEWSVLTDDVSTGDLSDGELLGLVDVTIAEPKHKVERGDVWRLGNHYLVCVDVFTGWTEWKKYLKGSAIFLPYCGPFTPLTEKSEKNTFIMVQPDTYIAGHILDRYSEAKGEEFIIRD